MCDLGTLSNTNTYLETSSRQHREPKQRWGRRWMHPATTTILRCFLNYVTRTNLFWVPNNVSRRSKYIYSAEADLDAQL